MKYIVTKQSDGTEEIFLFPRKIDHDCMAEMLEHIRNQMHGDWKRVFREPVAAGFVEDGECFGKSETLNLKSRPEDSKLLERIS